MVCGAAAAEMAERENVFLAIESTLDADDHQQIIDQVGSSAVGVYYDMGNATSFGYDSPTEIRQLGKGIVQMHMKDTGGNHAGEGDVDFHSILKILQDAEYRCPYIVRRTHSSCPSDDIVYARDTFKRMISSQ